MWQSVESWVRKWSKSFINCHLLFQTDLGKCLKVVHSSNQSVPIEQAMLSCANEEARLVPIQSCEQLTSLVKGVYEQYQLIDQNYFIGLSVLTNATDISKRNWEPVKIMDSWVFFRNFGPPNFCWNYIKATIQFNYSCIVFYSSLQT